LQGKAFSSLLNRTMKKTALIVAGGSGTRMGNQLPKQFIEISGKPLLMHTLSLFHAYDPQTDIVLVLPAIHLDFWHHQCRKYRFTLPHLITEGGATRFHSVKNGLDLIQSGDIVFIHDGVRPLVSHDTLGRCLDTASQKGNAIPAIPVSESVRWSEGETNYPVDRTRLVLIQTPQTFLLRVIKNAYQQEYLPEFTDDASVLEKTGEPIHLVEGNRENIKITWPEDLEVARLFLR
jgi:2-C-methyl-D-erythritol 4-phosphate cytidylyltransferase